LTLVIETVRPTMRCLVEDLGVNHPPPASQPLDTLDHVLLQKAQQLYPTRTTPGERIVSIDDHVFFKVKVERWRGAVDRDSSPQWQWLCAAGSRQEGSPDDFYQALVEQCRSWRKDYNRHHARALTTDTYSDSLLPTDDDRDRLLLEDSVAQETILSRTLPALVKSALHYEGVEQRAEIAGCLIGVYVTRDDFDSIYVGIRIIGSVPPDTYAVVLSEVPGTTIADWHIDAMPQRENEAAEVVWSAIMDPVVAESLSAAD